MQETIYQESGSEAEGRVPPVLHHGDASGPATPCESCERAPGILIDTRWGSPSVLVCTGCYEGATDEHTVHDATIQACPLCGHALSAQWENDRKRCMSAEGCGATVRNVLVGAA